MANLVCPLCVTPPFGSVAKLLRHIRVTHADADSFIIQCTLQGCCRTFKSFKSYQTHIYRHHNTFQGSRVEQLTTPAAEEDFSTAEYSDNEEQDSIHHGEHTLLDMFQCADDGMDGIKET